jgi:hypothetical protein
MPSTREVTRTEQRIVEVDALQQTIEQLQQDLESYTEALRQELELLRHEPAVAEPPPFTEPVMPEPLAEVEEEEQEPEPEEVAEEEPEPEPLPEPKRERDIWPKPAMKTQQGTMKLDEMFDDDLDERPPQDLGPEHIGGKPVSVMLSDGMADTEPFAGWVVDRPSGGLRILTDEFVNIGTVLGVKPTREHRDAMWINVSVKKIQPERQSFLLHCTFIERPPWNALALLKG